MRQIRAIDNCLGGAERVYSSGTIRARRCMLTYKNLSSIPGARPQRLALAAHPRSRSDNFCRGSHIEFKCEIAAANQPSLIRDLHCVSRGERSKLLSRIVVCVHAPNHTVRRTRYTTLGKVSGRRLGKETFMCPANRPDPRSPLILTLYM